MRSAVRYYILCACVLFGGCVESTFDLTRASSMPAGLRPDHEVMKTSATATLIQVWLYADGQPELRFYESDELVLTRRGDGYRNARPEEGRDRFFVTFNGVESKFHQIILPSIVVAEDGDSKK